MSNSFFQFKQFIIYQDRCAMKVTTDACLFGAWVASEVGGRKSEVGSVLDVGTGTGLLPLMLAQKNPNLSFDSIEIDKEAAEQAAENVKASQWKGRINVINADVKSFTAKKNYDFIISNPPFYEKDIPSAQDVKNIAHHSEELKMDELLTIIKNRLTTNGNFFLLLPYKRYQEIKKLLKNYEFHINKIVFVRQSTKHDYFRIMLRCKLHPLANDETTVDEIRIWDNNKQYTPDFVKLLKDYYLHL